MSVKPLTLFFGWLALTLCHATENRQCVLIAEELQQDERLSVTRRWEKTIDGLHSVYGAKLSPDGKRVVCRANDRLTVLNGTDGKVLWKNEQYSSGVFGYNPKELLARSKREDSTIGVLDLETGKMVREFKCPPNVGIEMQTKDGYLYWCHSKGKRIVRYKEGDADVEAFFDYKTTGEIFGEIRRVPHVTLLYVDEQKLFLTAKGRLAIIDLATRKINVPDQDTVLLPRKMLQRSSGASLFYTATRDAIVEIDDKGQLRQFAEVAIYNHGFVNRNQRLLVHAESTGEHQPAFIRVHELDTGRTQRIPWHSEEIGAVTPDASATMFMTFNRIGQIAVWDITDISATDSDAGPSPDNINRVRATVAGDPPHTT